MPNSWVKYIDMKRSPVQRQLPLGCGNAYLQYMHAKYKDVILGKFEESSAKDNIY